MEQLLAHLTGDYLLQNSWMAEKKAKSLFVASLHGLFYTIPFLFITNNLLALSIIGISHMLIDYLRLGHFIMWAKDQVAPKEYRSSWGTFVKNFPSEPAWIQFWIRIIIDNTIHLLINFFILRQLG